MLRMWWNRRMSSRPASRMTAVAAVMAATVMSFMAEPLFPFAVSFLTPIFGARVLNSEYAYLLTVASCGPGPPGPKVGTEGVVSPGGGRSRPRPAGAMTEVLPGQGHATLPADSGSREAAYVGFNNRASGPVPKEAPKMRRKTFDALVSAGGLVMAAVLLVAGGLLMWGYSFSNGQVHDQLVAQKIVFPTTGNPEFKALPAADQTAMGAYAGQTLTTGAQAKTYADHFIAVHLSEMGKGQTYSQLSGESLAQPKNVALAGLVQTVFRGTTLRSMLLEAYGFWMFGQIALFAAIASFTGAVLLLILSAIGLVHGRRVPAETEVLAKTTHAHPVTV